MTLNGYIKDLFYYYQPRTKYPEIDNEYFYTKVIHNRLNFRWYADDHLTFAVEARNRLIAGSLVRDLPFYESTVTSDPGYFDLSKVWVSEESWFLHTIVDRAWIEYSQGRWQITIGRQRINWGMNLIWSPNDLFNTCRMGVEGVVDARVAPSDEVARDWTGEVSAIFIDGAHDLEGVTRDFDTWFPRLRPGGFVFIYDSTPLSRFPEPSTLAETRIRVGEQFDAVGCVGSTTWGRKAGGGDWLPRLPAVRIVDRLIGLFRRGSSEPRG